MIVAAHRTPVSRKGRDTFERNFRGRFKLNEMTQGFIRSEFLKPLNGTNYIFMSYWETREDFEAWRKTDAGKKVFADEKNDAVAGEGPVFDLHEIIGISERVRGPGEEEKP